MVGMAAVAVLLLALCSAQPGLAKVHEVIWDVPANGLQLPSLSTAKCGDVIRFRCPSDATHGVYKLERSNYNGTCPTRYDAPQAGEVLSAPTKGCDFSLTLSDDPDFVITSQVAGACEQNLKMYVHAVCLKNEATSASSMLSSLAALPSSLSKMFSGSMMAIGGGSRAGEPQLDTRPTLGGGASLKRADSGEVGVLEAGKANAAAATVPVVAKAAAAAAAAVVFVLAL